MNKLVCFASKFYMAQKLLMVTFLDIVFYSCWISVAVQASLLSERQAAEEARKACKDADARNSELSKKLIDSQQKVDQLQESVQRFVNDLWNGTMNVKTLPYIFFFIVSFYVWCTLDDWLMQACLFNSMQFFSYPVWLLEFVHNFTIVMAACVSASTYFLIIYVIAYDFYLHAKCG